MRACLLLALAGVVAASALEPAEAEPIGPHFELSPFAGFTWFDGQLRSNGASLANDLYLGGRVGYQINSWLAIEGAAGITPTSENRSNGGDVDFSHASGDLLLSPWAGRVGGAYLFLGGGTSQVKPAGGDSTKNEGTLEVGGGLRIWLNDVLGLRLEMRQLLYSADGPVPDEDVRINHMILGGGIVLAMGARPRDTDADGVPDRKDQCAETPPGARVDARGCPSDGDGDRVWDGLDRCPDTPMGCTVDKSGCPADGDGDGVCDGVDQCADTPPGATVDGRGCPSDGDGDRVWEGLDKCPDTPKGCTVDESGCPRDGDGDGVCDGLDRCPDTSPGLRVDGEGCPIEVREKETELLDTGMIRLQDVNFETGQSTLAPESAPVLAVVGQVLSKWPELQIEIGGHTDARGSERYNQKLSEGRAGTVRSYLVAQFPNLKPEQFTAKGYGESRPVVPNTSALNWAKNRRVEFVVKNKEVLKREVERRRLLEKGEGLPAPAPADTLRLVPAPPDTLRPVPAPPDTTQP